MNNIYNEKYMIYILKTLSLLPFTALFSLMSNARVA